MNYTGISQDDQVALLVELAEVIDKAVLDRVAAVMTEMYVLDADIAALAMPISDGNEVERCDWCGEFGVIVGETVSAGLKYCKDCEKDGAE
jgi:hypothetical protein